MRSLLLLAAAVMALPGPSVGRARLRSATPRRRSVRTPLPRPSGTLGTLAVAAGIGGCAAAVAAQVLSRSGSPVLPVLTGAVAGGTVGRVVTTAAVRRRRERAAAAQVETIAALAAEVRAGQRPDVALAAAGPADLPPAVSAMWVLSERSGAPVAAVLDRIEDDLRSKVRQRQAVATQLAGARSTALLLAGLPGVGIAMGAAMGAAPLTILFGAGGGQLALLAGVSLDSAGVLWSARIVATAEDDR